MLAAPALIHADRVEFEHGVGKGCGELPADDAEVPLVDGRDARAVALDAEGAFEDIEPAQPGRRRGRVAVLGQVDGA